MDEKWVCFKAWCGEGKYSAIFNFLFKKKKNWGSFRIFKDHGHPNNKKIKVFNTNTSRLKPNIRLWDQQDALLNYYAAACRITYLNLWQCARILHVPSRHFKKLFFVQTRGRQFHLCRASVYGGLHCHQLHWPNELII